MQFQQNPEAVPIVWFGLLFVVLSIAVTALDDNSALLSDLGKLSSPGANRDFVSNQYRANALKCLVADDFISQYNLKTLQALVLLIYALNHAHRPSFPLLGLTQNIAFAIGAHVDPDHLGLSLLMSEERRRCWAGLVMLRTIQHSTLFMTDMQEFKNEVKLPADVDDLVLLNGAIQREDLSQRRPTQMTYILFKFGLYEITADICRLIYSTRNAWTNQSDTRLDIEGIDKRIHQEQEVWSTAFQMSPNAPIYHMVHFDILNMYAHQLLLLLHRPSAAFNHERHAYAENPFTQRVAARWSRSRCVYSALKILQIHATFHNSDQFGPYHWYHRGLGSFHAHHASIVLGAALLSGLAENELNDRSIEHIITRSDILSALSLSLERFSDLRDKSEVCKRAFPVIQKIWREISSRGPDTPGIAFNRPTNSIEAQVEQSSNLHSTENPQRGVYLRPRSDSCQQPGDGADTLRSPTVMVSNGSSSDRRPNWLDSFQVLDSPDSNAMPFETLLDNLQPENWLAPWGDSQGSWNQGSPLV